MFRFLHAADLHLDSPLRGLDRYEGAPAAAIRQASRRALEKLVDLAIAERVPFAVIAGDIYDGAWEDASTGLFFVQQMGRLREHGIRVFLIAGNHDAANRMTRSLPYPDNVRVFPDDQPRTELLPELRVAIHGQSYGEPKETRNLAIGYPAPVAGFFNISLLHTCLDGRDGHERYAPCQCDELAARGYDYWALGHIHQRESVNGDRRPRIEFPGNIQGRHIREPGAKGCLLVQADSGANVAVEFRPLDVFRWVRASVDCSGIEKSEDVREQVGQKLDQLVADSDGRPMAVRVVLEGCCKVHGALAAADRQLRDEIRARAVGACEGKIWVEKVELRTTPLQSPEAEPIIGEDALSILADVIDELRAKPALLQSALEGNELQHLNGRMPAELQAGDDAIKLADPAWAGQLLDRVRAILIQAATTTGSQR